MKNLVILSALLFLLNSCTKDKEFDMTASAQRMTNVQSCDDGILAFGSEEELAETLDAMQISETYDIASYSIATRSAILAASGGRFFSLSDYLAEHTLQELSDAELSDITSEALEYEPEDSLIIDPYLASVLNKDREIQIGNKIHRFVEEGLLIYPATDKNKISPVWKSQVNVAGLSHGQRIPVQVGDFKAELIKIDYMPHEEFEIDSEDSDQVDMEPVTRPHLHLRESGWPTVFSSRIIRSDGRFIVKVEETAAGWQRGHPGFSGQM